MTAFTIYALRQDVQKARLLYDNQTSALTWEDGRPIVQAQPGAYRDAVAVSLDQPGRKGNIRTLKVSLGLLCNYECSYCSQRFVLSTPVEFSPLWPE